MNSELAVLKVVGEDRDVAIVDVDGAIVPVSVGLLNDGDDAVIAMAERLVERSRGRAAERGQGR